MTNEEKENNLAHILADHDMCLNVIQKILTVQDKQIQSLMQDIQGLQEHLKQLENQNTEQVEGAPISRDTGWYSPNRFWSGQ